MPDGGGFPAALLWTQHPLWDGAASNLLMAYLGMVGELPWIKSQPHHTIDQR